MYTTVLSEFMMDHMHKIFCISNELNAFHMDAQYILAFAPWNSQQAVVYIKYWFSFLWLPVWFNEQSYQEMLL